MAKLEKLVPTNVGSPAAAGAVIAAAAPQHALQNKHSRLVLILLAVNTAVVVFGVGLVIAILGAPSPQTTQAATSRTIEHGIRAGNQQVRAAQSRPAAYAVEDPEEANTPAPSWAQAQKAYSSKNYAYALTIYRRLTGAAQSRPATDPIGDLILLRQAQCLLHLDRTSEAAELLIGLCQSGSPVVRATTALLMAQVEFADGRWAAARSRGYQAMAALGAMDTRLPLELDCEYIIADCLTREALALGNVDGGYQAAALSPADPFAGAAPEEAVKKLLFDGAQKLSSPVLSVRVDKSADESGVSRYAVACTQSSLEEVLAKIAAEAGVELRWETASPAPRQRAVSMSLSGVPAQQAVEIACGMAGLLARFTGDQIVVHEPRSASSTTQKRELLCAEAASVWRRLFLKAPQDARVAGGQFAMAVLCEAAGDNAGALAQYHLTATRYTQSDMAPKALLQSARLRIRLNDYTGASSDLLELLDSHPQYPACDQAYLNLGTVAMRSGQYDDAARYFRKLYHLDLSQASRVKACLGLGRCLYKEGDLKEAAKWLTSYLELSRQVTGEDAREAYLLLGRCHAANGEPGKAVVALRHAVAADNSPRHAAEATVELAQFLYQVSDYVGALGALRQVEAEGLSEDQTCQTLLLRARILLAMGLAEKASTILRTGLANITSPRWTAVIEVEQAKCRAAAGDWAGARDRLTDVLAKMSPGPDAWDATCELADICLHMGQNDQVVLLLQELLKGKTAVAVRDRAYQTLASAYLSQRDYPAAANALSQVSTPAEASRQ